VNGDNREDFFICGAAKASPERCFSRRPEGKFRSKYTGGPEWRMPNASENVDAVFFDADGDKDIDLYVASGQ
jgi:hypothetical protein